MTGTTTDPTFYDVQGTYTVTWSYDDGNGNISTQQQTVIVDDVTAPVPDVDPLPDATGECSVTVTAPTATDNCVGTVTGTTTDPTFYDVQGTYTVTWSYDDGNGNISTQQQTVVVDDVTAPVPDVDPLPDLTSECSVTVTAPTATDNCVGTVTGTTTDPTFYDVQGTYTITWSYDDGNGNISTQQQTVVVDDVTAPVPDVTNLQDAREECSVTVTAPTATDNCVGTVTGTTTDPTFYDVQGTYTITWSYDDGNGNISTQQQTVVVRDTRAPQPDVMNLPDATGECSVTVTTPTATDNCVGTVAGTTTDPTFYDVQGTYTVTWSYDDGNGNISTQQQTVIVDDVTAPVPDVDPLPDATGECSVTVTAPTATDNCVGTVTGTTTDPTFYDVQGTYTVTWNYDDGNGNISTQQQTVIVDDVSTPIPDVNPLPDLIGECSVTVSTTPTATDGCGGTTIIGTTTDPTFYDVQGTYTITWSYDDGNGNISTQQQTVVVDDVTAPVPDVDPLPDLTSECSVTVTAPTATDNCVGTVTGTTTDPTFYEVQGTYTITWSYDDGNGNISTQQQTVIVDDVTAPVPDVDPLPDATGECSVTVTAPTATDNCVGTVTGTTTDPTFYDVQGTYTVTWSYDDGNGNISTQQQTVIVDDVTAPVPDVDPLPDLTSECSVTVTAPTATDNCVGTVTGTTTDPTFYDVQGTYTVTWSYDDGNGNISTQQQTVVVDDVTAPVPDVDPLPDATGECSVTVTAPTATDNCIGAVTGTTTDPTFYDVQGTYTITWSYDDGNGNISTQQQTVVVDDVTAPVPDVDPLPDATGECNVTVTAPTATDNCVGTVTGTTTDPTFYDVQGTYTITWSYDDGNGNISTQQQTVVVVDVTAPVPDVDPLPDATGECNVTVTAPTATDNCVGTVTGTTTDPTFYDVQGTYTVTWSYDDGNGNISTQQQTVIVDDVTAPVPDVTNLQDAREECSVTVTAPTATDNCVGTVTGTTTDPTFYDVQGTYTVTWSYDDGNGNISTQQQTVIVDDVTAPVPDVDPLPDATGECNVTVTAPTATDNCVGTVTGTTTDPTFYDVQGTYTITWSYDDGNGNVRTQQQTVIVDDVTAPVPDVDPLPDATGECSVTVTAPTATDNCVGTVTGTTTDPTFYDVQGTYTVTWSYDDGNGNISTQQQTVIVDDVTVPTIDCPLDVIVSAEQGGPTTVNFNSPSVEDNCVVVNQTWVLSGATTGSSPLSGINDASGEVFNVGITAVSYTIEDANGNTATCSFNVTVQNDTDIVVSKTVNNNTPDEGDIIDFAIQVTNNGPIDATNIVITDVLPTGLSLMDGNPAIGTWSSPDWQIPNLRVGESAVLVLTAMVDPGTVGTSITNIISIQQDQTDTNNTPDDLEETITIMADKDGDGVPDLVDIDDDNDGILDTDEDLDLDGDNDPATQPTDTDLDGLPDYLDIDSDNDGIPDNIEAQSTLDYIFPDPQDTDGDGLLDVYEFEGDMGLFSLDSDNDDLPDYLDEDSDNDGVPDSIEGHDHNHDGIADVLFIGSDKDNDGLDDGYEGEIVLDKDVNDEMDDPYHHLPDTDQDELPDFRDDNDDGDQFTTLEEDLNGDGDYTNEDWDGDGIPDYLDIDVEEVVVEVFNVITPNGDGVHDRLKITGLESYPNNRLEIFNRWGVKVFSAEGYNNDSNYFDGTSTGRVTVDVNNMLPTGTYFYILTYEAFSGDTITRTGYLYINN